MLLTSGKQQLTGVVCPSKLGIAEHTWNDFSSAGKTGLRWRRTAVSAQTPPRYGEAGNVGQVMCACWTAADGRFSLLKTLILFIAALNDATKQKQLFIA